MIYLIEHVFQNKTKDLNLSKFNIITGIYESKTLAKHISCKYKYRFDGRKCNSDRQWNNDKCRCECKKIHVSKKGYVRNLATCNQEKGKHLACIINNSAITCDEIIDVDVDAEAKLIDGAKLDNKKILKEKKATCKMQQFYILLAFLLIAIALLIAAGSYCSLTKYLAQQKRSLQFHNSNNKLKRVLY